MVLQTQGDTNVELYGVGVKGGGSYFTGVFSGLFVLFYFLSHFIFLVFLEITWKRKRLFDSSAGTSHPLHMKRQQEEPASQKEEPVPQRKAVKYNQELTLLIFPTDILDLIFQDLSRQDAKTLSQTAHGSVPAGTI